MDYKRGIPLYQMGWANGHIEQVGKIQKLFDCISDIKKDGKPRTLTITYSFPKPKSTFLSNVVGEDGKPKEIITETVESPIPLRLLGRIFVKAFRQIADVIEYDFPLIKLKIKKVGRGYERNSRFIDYRTDIDITDERTDIGDINVFWMPLNNKGRLAECASEFGTTIGETSNAGLSLILNSEALLLLDDDPEIFKFRSVDNDVEQNRYSLLSVMIHELTHKFGFGHAPTNQRFGDSICFGTSKAAYPHFMRFRNDLWDDYYMRLGLSIFYQYSLENSILK